MPEHLENCASKKWLELRRDGVPEQEILYHPHRHVYHMLKINHSRKFNKSREESEKEEEEEEGAVGGIYLINDITGL